MFPMGCHNSLSWAAGLRTVAMSCSQSVEKGDLGIQILDQLGERQ